MLQTVAGGIQYCSFLAGACCSSPIAAAWAGLHTWFMPLLHRPATAPCLHPVAAGLIHGSCLDNASHQPPFSIQHATVADLIHGSWFMPSHQPPSLYPTVWLVPVRAAFSSSSLAFTMGATCEIPVPKPTASLNPPRTATPTPSISKTCQSW